MRIRNSTRALLATAAIGVLSLGAGSIAHARDVYWSVGVASPGVNLGLSNAPPVLQHRPGVVLPPQVYYSQPPVYYGQPPVYYSQPPVYSGPPRLVYGAPQVVYVQPQVVYQPQPYYVQSAWAPPVVYRNWGQRDHGHYGHHGHGYRDDRRGFNDGQRGDDHRGRGHR